MTVDLSIVRFNMDELSSVKKLENIFPNHVNLTCKCGNKTFADKTIIRWITIPQLIIVQTDLNKDKKKHEINRKINSDTNIFDPNRIPKLKDELKNIYVEKIKEFNHSKTKRLNSVITPSEIYIGKSKYSPIG